MNLVAYRTFFVPAPLFRAGRFFVDYPFAVWVSFGEDCLLLNYDLAADGTVTAFGFSIGRTGCRNCLVNYYRVSFGGNGFLLY